jgi:hypothetical protein
VDNCCEEYALTASPSDLGLSMTTLFNAWERDAEEWEELFAKADRGFEFVGINQPPDSALALIEVRWVGHS